MVDAQFDAVTGPMAPQLLPTLTTSLLTIGLLASAAFYMREEGLGGKRRSLAEEAILAAVAAACLGFGTTFLLLWCGVYLG